MAYDEGLAMRIGDVIADRDDVYEKKMFGGIAYMRSGHMAVGIVEDKLMVRVGKENYAAAMEAPHVEEMTFTGRPLTGMVYVRPEGIADDEQLRYWIDRGLEFAGSLPPK